MDIETKKAKAEQLRGLLEGAPAVVIVEFSGLTVADADELRTRFRDAGCTYHVYKNSTIRFAVQDTPHEAVQPLLKGVSALAWNADDPGAPARVARDFSKDHDSVQVKGGVIEGELLDAQGVSQLADLPSPDQLKSMFLSVLNAPATQMVRVLNAAPQGFLNVLIAKKDQDAA